MREFFSWKRLSAIMALLTLVSIGFYACGSGGNSADSLQTVTTDGFANGHNNPRNPNYTPPPTATNYAMLSWNAPTTNTDGSTLTNLAGYKVCYGTTSGNYDVIIDVGKVLTYTVTNLAPGTYYFAVKTCTTSGTESGYSNEASKTIQ